MTLQELLEKYESMLEDCEKKALPAIAELKVVCQGLQSVLNDLRPTVSAEVADWYEFHKEWIATKLEKDKYNLAAQIIFMHEFGYDIAEEPVYRIISKSTSNFKGRVQVLCQDKNNHWFWCAEFQKFKTAFTREELESNGFPWVFSCDGIDVVEVGEGYGHK